ncbi:M56 family metallopeptidase [Zunongwangia sp.]|uniref:M56 family metallopeptidase n=1 Tax=Zunongwangia sp. TaxID=1965325 RepID=UPI003AA97E47
MEDFMFHLLKSAGLITIFFAYYRLVLKNQSIIHNRFFLLFGLLAAIVLPFIYFTQKITLLTNPAEINYETYSSIASASDNQSYSIIDNLPYLVFGIYLLGVVFLLIKFIVQLNKLQKIYITGTSYTKNSLYYIETELNINPFSFFKGIFINPKKHNSTELNFITKHEEAHAKQWHSIDILFAHFCCIFTWFNPFSWLYKKEINKNLEFLADREAAEKVMDTKAYQKTLLKISTGFSLQLSNHFYQSFIKKRILMLNKQSQPVKQWKLLLILPILCTFIYSFNRKTETVYASKASVAKEQNQQQDSISNITIIQLKKSNTPTLISEEKKKSETTKTETKQTVTQCRKILYYINDELKPDNFDIAQIDKEDIFSLNIYKSKEELIKRNAAEYDAIIDIKTKDYVNKKGTNTKNVVIYKSKKKVRFSSQNEIPLFVLNGKIISKKEMSSIEPKSINKINVLKGENATRKYGKKGTNGVVQIYTKQEPQVIVFTITASTTDAALHSNIKKLKADFGILIEIKRLKRNNNQKIKSIKLKAKKEENKGWKSSYSASDSDQIDDFYMIYNKAEHSFTMTSDKPKAK